MTQKVKKEWPWKDQRKKVRHKLAGNSHKRSV